MEKELEDLTGPTGVVKRTRELTEPTTEFRGSVQR